MKRTVLLSCFTLLLLTLTSLAARPQPRLRSPEAYGTRFFEQLQMIFGRFRDSDLQRVFLDAVQIQCSELIGKKGEWRPVAFFNEDRSLGSWCRSSIDEVKTDLVVYTFTGSCSSEDAPVRVASEFPTAAAIAAYKRELIEFDEVDITVNDPVEAALNPKTKAYTFELPYLFLTSGQDLRKIYSFFAPDRDASYAIDVSSRWECKAVVSGDVTYRFLICRVNTVPQEKLARNQRWEPSFGSSAFFILSDGTEAQTEVNLTFGDEAKPQDPSEPENK